MLISPPADKRVGSCVVIEESRDSLIGQLSGDFEALTSRVLSCSHVEHPFCLFPVSGYIILFCTQDFNMHNVQITYEIFVYILLKILYLNMTAT